MVGSNCSLNLWYDRWLAVGSIRSLIVGPLPRKLCYFEMLEMGELGPLGLLFLCSLVVFFNYWLKFHVPLCSSCDDIIVWASSSKGSFESKNAYPLANGTSNNNPSLSRKSIWKLDTLPKIQSFLWKCFLHRIPTKDIIEIRGFTGDVKCQIFYGDRESMIHVLRDCPYAKWFRDNSQACTLTHDIYSMDICAWLEKNYGINTSCNDLIPWNMFFSFAIWSL